MKNTDNVDNLNAVRYARLVYRVIHIAVLIYFAYELYLRATIGRPTSNLLIYFLVLTIPVKIYKNIAARNEYKGDTEKLKSYDKIIIRSFFLAIVIVAVFVTAVVLYSFNKA